MINDTVGRALACPARGIELVPEVTKKDMASFAASEEEDRALLAWAEGAEAAAWDGPLCNYCPLWRGRPVDNVGYRCKECLEAEADRQHRFYERNKKRIASQRLARKAKITVDSVPVPR